MTKILRVLQIPFNILQSSALKSVITNDWNFGEMKTGCLLGSGIFGNGLPVHWRHSASYRIFQTGAESYPILLPLVYLVHI